MTDERKCAAPAAPLPEPVAWQYRCRWVDGRHGDWQDCGKKVFDNLRGADGFETRELYAAVPAQPAQPDRDAERYRWLRDEACNMAVEAPYVCFGDGRSEDFSIEGAELDAAMDDAMKDAPPTQEPK